MGATVLDKEWQLEMATWYAIRKGIHLQKKGIVFRGKQPSARAKDKLHLPKNLSIENTFKKVDSHVKALELKYGINS